MPRKPVKYQAEFPYHICARTVNKEDFKISTRDVWDIMEDYLYLLNKFYAVEILSFVLMRNHFHLLAATPDSNLGPAMNFFMRETSTKISRAAGRINQTYGGRYGRSMIIDYRYFVTVYKYVYRNPVRANICKNIEDYPFSSLYGLLGKAPLVIPVLKDPILFTPGFNQTNFNWLNAPTNPEDDLELQQALRKSVLTAKKVPATLKIQSK
jgi:putative transposase